MGGIAVHVSSSCVSVFVHISVHFPYPVIQICIIKKIDNTHALDSIEMYNVMSCLSFFYQVLKLKLARCDHGDGEYSSRIHCS
jgi:hypothetical protein